MIDRRERTCFIRRIRTAAALLALCLAAGSPARAEARAIIAVFDMTAEGLRRIKTAELKRLTDYLANQLTAKGAFRVVPRDRLIQQLRSQKKTSFKKCFDQSCQIEIGRELAANKSLATKVMRFDRECIVTATLYDLKTATTEGAASAKSKNCKMGGLLKAVEEVATKLSGGQVASGGPDPDPGPGPMASGGAKWPPACPAQPKACLAKASTFKEPDQSLMAALFSVVQAERKGRWKVRGSAREYVKKLLEGYIPRRTQLEDGLKGSCRRDARACYALAMLKAADGNAAEALRYLRLGCDKNEPGACNALGNAHKNGKGIAKNANKAVSLYRRACDRNFLPGCVALAGVYRYGAGAIAKDLNRAIALYRRACDRNLLRACSSLAGLYSWSERKDYKKALALYRRACDANQLSSCSSLAYMYRNGRGVAANETKAKAIYKRACDAGYKPACSSMTSRTSSGSYLSSSSHGGKRYLAYKDACNKRNSAYDCDKVGYAYRFGSYGALKLPSLAIKYYQKACNLNYGSSCNALSTLYLIGKGVAKSRTQSDYYRNLACKRGYSSACRSGSTTYSSSSSYGSKPYMRYREGCNKRNNAYDCDQLGLSYSFGNNGAPKLPTLAAKYYRKACDLGRGMGCANLASLYTSGKGVTRSTSQAAYFRRLACQRGHKGSCSYGSTYSAGSTSSAYGSSYASKPYRRHLDACNRRSSAYDCDKVGYAYRFGSYGAPKLPTLAVTYYRKACDMRYGSACNSLATLYSLGTGVTRNMSQYHYYRNLACQRGYSSACSKSGYRSSSSSGKPYLDHSRRCTSGSMFDCNQLGLAYSFGSKGAMKSKLLARVYYRKACNGNFAMGCANLAHLYKTGQGGKVDMFNARVYYRKACRLGHRGSCGKR